MSPEINAVNSTSVSLTFFNTGFDVFFTTWASVFLGFFEINVISCFFELIIGSREKITIAVIMPKVMVRLKLFMIADKNLGCINGLVCYDEPIINSIFFYFINGYGRLVFKIT